MDITPCLCQIWKLVGFRIAVVISADTIILAVSTLLCIKALIP